MRLLASSFLRLKHWGLRLLKEHDESRLKWREQIELGWHQAQRGQLVDGNEVFDRLDKRLKVRRTRNK